MTTLVLAPHAILVFLVALFITHFFGKRNPQFFYALWLLVLLKLLIPLSFHDFRVADLHRSIAIEETNEDPFPIQESVSVILQSNEAERRPIQERLVNQPDTVQAIDLTKYLNLSTLFLFLWFSGSLFILIRGIGFILGVYRQLNNSRIIQKGAVYKLFLDCVEKMGLAYTPRLVSTYYYDVPFVIGFWSRKMTVVLPAELLENKEPSTLTVIFSHELSHIKKHDYAVNLFRFVVLVLFHVHPIRWFADRYVFHYQEITTDLFALRKMKIPQPKYVDVLVNVLLGIDENTRKNILQSSLLTSQLSVVKRMDYVSDYIPYNRLVHIGSILLMGLATLSSFGTSISVYIKSSFEDILEFNTLQPEFQFPSPIFQGPTLSRQSDSRLKQYRNLYWNADPRFGINGFSFNSTAFSLVSSYSFPLQGAENKTEQITDFDFWGDFIFLGIGSPNSASNEQGRIDVLQWFPDSTITKVASIDTYRVSSIKVVENYLWVLERTPDQYTNILSIYDIQNPIRPEILDTRSLEGSSLKLEHNPNTRSVFLTYNNGFAVYTNPQSLAQDSFVYLPYDVLTLQSLNENLLVIAGSTSESLNVSNEYLSVVSKQNNEYVIKSTYRLLFQDKFTSVNEIIPLENSLLVTFSNHGIAQLRILQNTFIKIVSFNTISYLHGSVGQELVFNFPETVVYNLIDFGPSKSTVINWNNLDMKK